MKKVATGVTIFIFMFGLCFYDVVFNYVDEYFPLTKIQVEASFNHINKQDIATRIENYTKHGLLRLDAKAMKQSLTQLPWVAYVNVERIWPGTLYVKIDERQPIVLFNETGLIDASGVLFQASQRSVPDLPKIIAKDKEGFEKELLQEFKKVSSILINVSLSLKQMEKESSTLTLTMKDGFTIVLSSKEAVSQLTRFIGVYPELKRQKTAPLLQADLRYQHGLAVKWK
jgi:cell division protein FtsQ